MRGWLKAFQALWACLCRQKRWKVWAFVRMSAHWSTSGMWTTWIRLVCTFSRTKNRSNSICLLQEWRTGLWAKATVLVSQRITGEAWESLSSESRDKIQVTSTATKVMLLYSASVLDLATTVCILDHQEIKFGPRKIAAPDVDLLSSGSEAYFALQ